MSPEAAPGAFEQAPDNLLESSSPTCMQDDLRAAHTAGSAEVGGTTVITESAIPVTYRPDKYVRDCGTCALCGVSAEFYHQIDTWRDLGYAGRAKGQLETGEEARRRVKQQCLVPQGTLAQ